MAQIRIQILDDLGQELRTKQYDLGTDLESLSKIEDSIEKLRAVMLSDITHELLSAEQTRHEKKRT